MLMESITKTINANTEKPAGGSLNIVRRSARNGSKEVVLS
jgi:hypothetical protein